MNIAVYCSSSSILDSVYYHQAEELGKWIGCEGHTLVYGGCKLGLMESVSDGVKRAKNGKVIGVVPKILIELDRVSKNSDEIIYCDDLTERKKIMMERSDIFIAMPGSVGTLDEAFSVIAQHSIGIDNKMVIFWNINGFWDGLFSFFESLKTTGVAYKPLENFYYKADSLEDIKKICAKL